jgi:hypothetical protein
MVGAKDFQKMANTMEEKIIDPQSGRGLHFNYSLEEKIKLKE